MFALTWINMQAGAMAETEAKRSDEDLLRAFQRGEDAAFDELFLRFERRLVGYLANLTGSIDTARDIAQDTFLKLIRKPPLVLRSGTVKGWLFRVGRNQALDLLRRDRKQEELPTDRELGSEDESPADVALKLDDLAQVQKELAELSDELRDIVCQRIYGNLSFKEISSVSGIPIGTALWRMHRAMDELRGRLRRAGHER